MEGKKNRCQAQFAFEKKELFVNRRRFVRICRSFKPTKNESARIGALPFEFTLPSIITYLAMTTNASESFERIDAGA